MDTHALMARNLTQKERKSMAASPTQSATIAHKSRSMARQMGRTEEGLAFAEVADSQALASSETVGVGGNLPVEPAGAYGDRSLSSRPRAWDFPETCLGKTAYPEKKSFHIYI